MPLGQHLRANQHIDGAAVGAGQMLLKAARATRGVGINAQYAQRLAIGAAHGLQLLVQRLFQLLGSLAHGAHVLIPTIRACARNPHGIPAMVTAQSAVNLVEHPVGAAMRTLAFPATARAVQDRRIPAAIEQKQALLATQCALLHRLEQRLAAHGAARLLRHVDHTHRGQSCRADALGHAQPQVTAARIVLRNWPAVVPALQRRRSRTQQHGCLHLARTVNGQIARRIARAFLLLVTGVMLLVDNDQAQPRNGRQHRHARAQDNASLAGMGRQPPVQALRGRHAAVQRNPAL